MGRIPGYQEEQCLRLFEEVLLGARVKRRHRFSFLCGDPTPARPQGVPLPVDAYFPTLHLVVEYMGQQHFERNPLMDRRPGRREQRLRYQKRREEVLLQQGITVLRAKEWPRLCHRPSSDGHRVRPSLAVTADKR